MAGSMIDDGMKLLFLLAMMAVVLTVPASFADDRDSFAPLPSVVSLTTLCSQITLGQTSTLTRWWKNGMHVVVIRQRA